MALRVCLASHALGLHPMRLYCISRAWLAPHASISHPMRLLCVPYVCLGSHASEHSFAHECWRGHKRGHASHPSSHPCVSPTWTLSPPSPGCLHSSPLDAFPPFPSTSFLLPS
eukprot:289255-Chlamydomonas_euryale.AAC.4